jgi:hypothetical protein
MADPSSNDPASQLPAIVAARILLLLLLPLLLAAAEVVFACCCCCADVDVDGFRTGELELADETEESDATMNGSTRTELLLLLVIKLLLLLFGKYSVLER